MDFFKQHINETVGMGGVNYEKKVEAVMDRLSKENSNFKRIASAGGAFSSAGAGDASFTINGKTINMEIKMDGNAQMGGTSISYERDADGFVGQFPDRLVDRFDFSKIKEEDIEMFSNALIPVVKYLDQLLDHFSSLNDPFYDDLEGFPLKVKNKDWENAKKAGLIIPTNKVIKYNAQWIREHYQKKGVDYIQIGGMGLFHTGKDPLGLGVPILDGDINIEMRPGPAGSGGKPFRSVGYRVQGRLKLKGTKSPVSFDNYESIKRAFGNQLKGLKESVELAEAHAKDIVKGITDMDGPFTVVAIKNNKVIKQKDTKMRDALPAIVKTMRKEVGSGVTISIEGKKGILNTFKEEVKLDEEAEVIKKMQAILGKKSSAAKHIIGGLKKKLKKKMDAISKEMADMETWLQQAKKTGSLMHEEKKR